MTQSERNKANRACYLSRNLCPWCWGKSRIVPGRVLCVECQQKHDDWQRERNRRWREEGKCIRCGRERAPGRMQCQNCLDRFHDAKYAKASKRYRDEKKAQGLCTSCGTRWAEPGKTKCKKCLDRHKQYNAKAAEAARKRRAARVAAGLCIDAVSLQARASSAAPRAWRHGGTARGNTRS